MKLKLNIALFDYYGDNLISPRMKYFISDHTEYRSAPKYFKLPTDQIEIDEVFNTTTQYRYLAIIFEIESLFKTFNGDSDENVSNIKLRYSPIGHCVIPFLNQFGKTYTITDTTDTDHIINVATIQIDDTSSAIKKTPRTFAKDDIQELQELAMRPISRYLKFYQSTIPLNTIVKLMHIPLFKTYLADLPASVYILLGPKDKEISHKFVKRLISISCFLYEWSIADFYDILEKQLQTTTYHTATTFALRILFQAVCITANTMEYMFDTNIAMTDVELFKISRNGLYAGDCEDLAKEIQMVFESIRKMDPRGDREINILTTFLSKYVCAMVTGVANTANLTKFSTDENAICHIYCLAIPTKFFIDHVTSITLTSDTTTLLWETELKSYILEGTNFCNPLHLPLSLYTSKTITTDIKPISQQSNKVLDTLFKEFPYIKASDIIQPETILEGEFSKLAPLDISRFYRWSVDLWVDCSRFGSPSNICFTFMKNNIYGIDFKDILYVDPNISIVPVFTYEPNELHAIHELLKYNIPVVEYDEDPKEDPLPDIGFTNLYYNPIPKLLSKNIILKYSFLSILTLYITPSIFLNIHTLKHIK